MLVSRMHTTSFPEARHFLCRKPTQPPAERAAEGWLRWGTPHSLWAAFRRPLPPRTPGTTKVTFRVEPHQRLTLTDAPAGSPHAGQARPGRAGALPTCSIGSSSTRRAPISLYTTDCTDGSRSLRPTRSQAPAAMRDPRPPGLRVSTAYNCQGRHGTGGP